MKDVARTISRDVTIIIDIIYLKSIAKKYPIWIT